LEIVCVNFGSAISAVKIVFGETNSYWYFTMSKSDMTKKHSTMLSGVKKRRFVATKKPDVKIRPSLRIDRLKEAKDEDTRRRKKTRAKRGSSTHGKNVDWSKMDLMGDPIVSFEPGDRDRHHVLEVLSRKSRDSVRIKLVSKLCREFCRIYTRYRRQAERELRGSANYKDVSETERRYAEQAAVLCIQKGVTPTRLIQYWHKAVRNFTDLKIPTLRFLSSPTNIDQVACVELEEPKSKPPAGNSFSAVYGLDPRLRSTLERAGFDTRPFNDRFLLGVQHNAMSIVQGKDIFMANGVVRDMATYAAEHLFNED
jgi:hypothetical protein